MACLFRACGEINLSVTSYLPVNGFKDVIGGGEVVTIKEAAGEVVSIGSSFTDPKDVVSTDDSSAILHIIYIIIYITEKPFTSK